MFFYALKQFELRLRAYQVMFRILNLIICIAVDIIGKEAYALHIGEQSGSIGQVLYLYRQQERFGRLQITFCECLEYFHIEVHIREVFIIFQPCIGSRTQEIAKVGKDKAGHYGIKVDDTKDIAVFIKHHIIDFRIAMANALGQLTFAMQAFRLAHFIGTTLYLIQKIPYFLYTSGSVGRHGIAKLFQAEFHIMEIGNRLA